MLMRFKLSTPTLNIKHSEFIYTTHRIVNKSLNLLLNQSKPLPLQQKKKPFHQKSTTQAENSATESEKQKTRKWEKFTFNFIFIREKGENSRSARIKSSLMKFSRNASFALN